MRASGTICFCNTNIPWGGGEAWHLNAARSLSARGRRVLFLCHPDGALYGRAASIPHITTIPVRLGRLSFLNPLLRGRLVRLFKAEGVDALIMNLPSDLKAAGPAAAQAGVRHIIYRRGSALPVRNSLMNRYLYGKVITGLIANSRATKEQVLVNNPRLIREDRISIIPNGIDIAAFDAGLERARGATPLLPPAAGKDGKRPLILGTAGRLNRQKAQHLVLELGKKLSDAGLDCRIVLAGAGEREQELKRLAATLGLRDRAVFCGFMPDLAPFWLGIDIFVLTSLWEGFGNVVIEAGLAERPVLAFAVSNLPELVMQGPAGNGMLFPLPPGMEERALRSRGEEGEGDCGAALSAMAEAVLALAASPEKLEAMGRAGRCNALRYSQERCMDTLEALLR